MAAEAEAAREARAKIIRAHGEEKATKALKQAADELAHNPHAIQLRYLQVYYSFPVKSGFLEPVGDEVFDRE